MKKLKVLVFWVSRKRSIEEFIPCHFPKNKKRDLVWGLFSKKMKNDKGFTLIELLVVVGVISLLASVVLVGSKALHDRGKDGAIMQELSQVRRIAQMILAEEQSFEPLCADGTLNDATYSDLAEIETEVRRYNGGQAVVCHAEIGAFCVQSPMHLTDGYCVDSTGQATTSLSNCDEDAVCEP
jgi:prepilin-type N-terminal cleavage/methylation domain-containing protein